MSPEIIVRDKILYLPDTYTSNGMIDDLKIASHLLKYNKPGGKYLELGVFRGLTLIQMIEFSGMECTGVDRWSNLPFYFEEDLEGMYYWLQHFYGHRCRLIRGETRDVLKQLAIFKERFDLIFVDADHSYEGVKEDIRLSWPLLNEGGVFAGHDYNQEGVAKAVSEHSLIVQQPVEQIKYSIIWVMKHD